jgi:hypothetical protein
MRRALVIACLLTLQSPLAAQRLPSEERKPALTRKENWGLSIGVDVVGASFQPTRCLTLVIGVFRPCDDVEWAYKTRGIGASMNAGVLFLRHFMLGGEVGTVGFSGNRTFTSGSNPPVTYTASTTNSLFGSMNAGLITSPIGSNPRLGRKWWVGGLAGHSWWSGERLVKSCEQCKVDPLVMGNAYFLQPFAMFGGGDKDGGGGLRISYRHYMGGNRAMHSGATLGLFFAFGRL